MSHKFRFILNCMVPVWYGTILGQLFSLSDLSSDQQPSPWWWRRWANAWNTCITNIKSRQAHQYQYANQNVRKFTIENPRGQQAYPTISSQFGFLTNDTCCQSASTLKSSASSQVASAISWAYEPGRETRLVQDNRYGYVDFYELTALLLNNG